MAEGGRLEMEFSLDSLEISTEENNDEVNSTLLGRCTDAASDHNNSLTDLSSWEKWLLKKTIEDMQKRKKEREQLIEAKTKEKEEKTKQKEKRIKGRAYHQKWVEEKEAEAARKRKELNQQKELESLETTTKKLNRDRRSKESYHEWCQMKTKQQLEQKKVEAEKHEKKKKEQECKERLAEQAYKDWLQKTKRQATRQTDQWWANTNVTSRRPSWNGPLDNSRI